MADLNRGDDPLTWPEFFAATATVIAEKGPGWLWRRVLCRPWVRWLIVGTIAAALASWESSSSSVRQVLLTASLVGSLVLLADLSATAVWLAWRKLRARRNRRRETALSMRGARR